MGKEKIIGYKVFNPDWTCRGFQYKVGETFELKGSISVCNTGFHFCEKVADCFEYYSFDPKNKVALVHAVGKTIKEGNKSCTDKILIVQEITWEEMLKLANEGEGNTGLSNTGYSNTGDWNTGDRNTGYSNTGNSNTGDRNTGDWNTGNRNTGYSNTGDRNTGAFCTEEPPFTLFDKPSKWTEEAFLNSKAYQLMRSQVDTKMWIPAHAMSEKEKTAYPAYKTAEGYVKDIPFKEAFQNAWHNWNKENRKAFTSLPNFDADKFFEITGVRV